MDNGWWLMGNERASGAVRVPSSSTINH